MCSSIILLPNLHYREIARKNWGLTKEQMKGMHVHHRIPVSKGGSDAPENLYVCSPSFHANIWHNENEFTLWANEGGKKSVEVHKQNGTWNYDKEFHKKVSKIRHTVFREPEVQSELGKRGAQKCKELGVNACFDKSIHERMSNPKLDYDRREKIREKNSQEWEITFPDGHIEIIKNMLQFCKNNNLNPGHMTEVSKGNRKHHKNFKCKKL